MIAETTAYWNAAAEARSLTGREDAETISAAIDEVVGFALHAQSPLNERALELLRDLCEAGPGIRGLAADAAAFCEAPPHLRT